MEQGSKNEYLLKDKNSIETEVVQPKDIVTLVIL